MNMIVGFLSSAFTALVLKPFDYLLFGGSGVLWRSREEWREMIHEDLRTSGPVVECQIVADEDIHENPYLGSWNVNTPIPHGSETYGNSGKFFLMGDDD